MNKFEKLSSHVFVTKLAGFEHTKYIQGNQTHEKINQDDVPLVQGKNIRNGIFVNNHEWYIPKEISDYLVRSKLDKPCILIPYVGSNLGEIGIFYHEYDCHMASNIAKVELIDDHFDLEYLKYYLQSDIGQAYLFQAKQGSAQPNITMESIRETFILDIDLKIQKQISNILKLLDDKIQLNDKINAELESIAKTLYDYWFLQFEFPNEEGKPYKSSGGKMVWNEELKREIPEGWEIGNLYDIADFINGLACQKYRPVNDTEKLPVIKITEMHDGITDNTEFVRSDIPENNIINDGDILFSWSATLETMIWTGGKCGLNQHIFKVIPNNISKYYVFMQLSSYIGNFVKMAEARKTTMGHITTEHLKQSKIVLPNKAIAEMFDKKISDVFRMIIKNNQEKRELMNVRDFLLPLLMNGQVGFKEK